MADDSLVMRVSDDGTIEVADQELAAGIARLCDARRLIDEHLIGACIQYALHEVDLALAIAALDELTSILSARQGATRPMWLVVLLDGALIAYMRCFLSSEGRGSLGAEIFPAGPPREAHHYWREVRDGHVAHDKNAGRGGSVFFGVSPAGSVSNVYVAGRSEPHITIERVASLRELAVYARDWCHERRERADLRVLRAGRELDTNTLSSAASPRLRSSSPSDLGTPRPRNS